MRKIKQLFLRAIFKKTVLAFTGLAIIAAGALVFVYNAKADLELTVAGGAVAPVTAGVDDLIGQNNAQWKFTMTATNILAVGKIVQIVFPEISGPPFSFGAPAIIATTTSSGAFGLDPTVAVNPGTRTLGFVVVDNIPAGAEFSITVDGINNPLGSKQGLTGLNVTFNIGTIIGLGGPADPITVIGTVDAAGPLLIRGGYSIFSAADSAITASNYAAGATNVTYTFSFVATTSIPAGGKINVHFPTEFTITNATTTATEAATNADINGSSANTPLIAATGAIATSTSTGRNDVIFTTSGAATGGANTVTVAVGGITNPATANAYRPIYLYTTNANGGLLDGSPFADSVNDVYNGPPPVDSIHIGGTNNMVISVYKQVGAGLVKLNASEIAQVRAVVGCPDKQFFVGTRYLDGNASTTFSNLLDCNYKVGVEGAETSNATSSINFFNSFLQPGMMDVSAVGGVTKNINLVFGVPDETWTGTITGGPTTGSSKAVVQAFDGKYQSWNPIFTDTSYTTQGFAGSGNGYFRLKVKTGSSWKINVMSSGATIADGAGNKFWPPVIPSIYASSTDSTDLGSFAYVLADQTLTITLKNSATNATITGNTCVGVKRTGGGIFMGSQETNCSANSGDNYVFKVPTGAITVEVMKPGIGKSEEYPLSVSGATAKTINVSAPSSFITVTVRDSVTSAQYPLGTPISGAPIFANSSSGFGQAMTGSNGVATIYVPAGTYRVEGFSPGLGQLTAQTGIVVSNSSNPAVTFTVNLSGFKTISGTVTQGGVGLGNVQIGARGTGNTNSGNGTVTNSDGTYTLRVPAGTYSVGGWSQATGGLVEQAVDVSSANATGKNWSLGASGTLRIIVSGGANISPLFGGAFDATTGRGSGTDTWVASSTDKYVDITLPAADGYEIHVGSPVTGEITPAGGDTANITAGQTTTKTYNVSGVATLVTLNGKVIDGSAADVASANVWVSRVDGPGFYSTLTDASGNYSFKVPDTYTYRIGIRKSGYLGVDSDVTMSGDETKNFTLASAGSSITGTITSDGATGLASAWVSAKKTGSDTWTSGPTDAAGNYSLAVDASTDWTIYAEGPCYLRSTGLAASAGNTDKDITLTLNTNCTAPTPQVNALTASTGGMVSNGEKMKVDIPANALGTDSSSVSISVQDADMAVSTANANPLKNSVQSITASNSSGSITSLNSKATLTIQYQESDLPVGFDESEIQMAYFDSTTGQWEPVAATVDTTLNTLTAQIDHFTDYGGITPRVPDVPQSLAASAASASQINLTWSATTITDWYDVYRSTTSGGTFTAIGSSTSATYSDTGLSASTAYYYKITAVNDSGASAYSSEVNATTNAAAATTTTAPVAGGGSPSLGASSNVSSLGLAPTPSPSPSPSSSPSANASVTLIRYEGDSKVYVVESGQKRWIQTAEDFAKLGYKWSDVKTVLAGETYPDGTVMKAPSASSAVTLIRYEDDPKVYVVENSQKRWVKTAEDFNKLGYKWSDVKIAPATETYATGSEKTFTPAATSAVTLIRYEGDPKVYVVENNQKRWVKTGEDFSKLGYKWSDVKIAPASEIYADGTAKIATAALTKTLKKGSTGAEVKTLQQKLKDLGYFPENVDTTTYFGSVTLQALKNFQKDKNLSPTGQLNNQTRDLLNQ